MARSRSKSKSKSSGKKPVAKGTVKTTVKKITVRTPHGDGGVISLKAVTVAQANKKK